MNEVKSIVAKNGCEGDAHLLNDQRGCLGQQNSGDQFNQL